MIDSIDFCVSFIGENSGILAKLLFGTLAKHCKLDGITFHVINKQISSEVWSLVTKSVEKLNRPVVYHNLDTGWHPYANTIDSFSFSPPDLYFNDAARTADLVVNCCGHSEWCILSHFDVIWRADIINWLRDKQNASGAMMVGSHCPIMLLNRPAYHKCDVDFHSATSDVGVDLGCVLGAVGFDYDMEWCFHHLGGGGGYHTRDEFISMRERVNELIQAEGL